MSEDRPGRPGAPATDLAAERRLLVEAVEADVRRFGTGDGSFTLDAKVRDVLARIERERFVPPDLRTRAYLNRPLPIGHGQTISQPLIVALMTHHLHLEPAHRVLEVGTGCGYQTAFLAELAREVVTIEVIEPLARDARARLEAMGYGNVIYRVGDGAAGAPELAPFDGILVTAAASRIPPPLIEQLVPGGRMVIPVGGYPHGQELMLVTRDEAGATHERTLFPVAFVPLT